jgi:hypothetical protein
MRLAPPAVRAGTGIVVIWLAALPAWAQHVGPDSESSPTNSTLQLRLVPGKLQNGLPEEFTFVFVNNSVHQVRMPRPSQCSGGAGTVLLRSQFKPMNPLGVPSGGGGGCGSGHAIIAPAELLRWAKSWNRLTSGGSLAISYSRRDLFNFQEDDGSYEFWGEYVPPQLNTEQIELLRRAGFDLPVPLASTHIHLKRPQ